MGDWDHPDDDEFAEDQLPEDQDPGPDINFVVTFNVTVILVCLTLIAVILITEVL
jgi:hypothetical protein